MLDHLQVEAVGDGSFGVVAVGIVLMRGLNACGAGGAGQKVALVVGVAVDRAAGHGDGGDVRAVAPVGVGRLVAVQIRDLFDPALFIIAVDIAELLPEQLRAVKVKDSQYRIDERLCRRFFPIRGPLKL